MYDIWHEVNVALTATAAAVFTERLLECKLYQKMLQVVNCVRIRGIADGRALLQVRVMPEQILMHSTQALIT